MSDLDSKTFEISWTNIESGSCAMANYISSMEKKPDIILSTQEDVVAASLVCNKLDLPLCVAHLDNYINGILVDCLPTLSKPIRSGVFEQAALPSIAIISTLIDNKRTVNGLIDHYKKQGHSVTTMSIYSRKVVDNPPDYNWTYLVATVNAVFPWEKL